MPGDPSSAAFWACAAAALPGSFLELRDVGLNPSRTAIFDVLRRFGADIDVQVDRIDAEEPVGRVRVRHQALRRVELTPADVPGLIDELPVLAALATHGGELRVTGAGELRAKESDRITALVNGLRALGADADELPDGFHVRGSRRLLGGEADAADDHRLAMAFAVAGLGGLEPTVIHGADAVNVSYPGFFDVLDRPPQMTVPASDKLYLVGFMGSGKTTVARALGRRLGWRVIDLDEEIERREGRSVSQVFAQDGEPYFRKVEREVLLAFLPGPARHRGHRRRHLHPASQPRRYPRRWGDGLARRPVQPHRRSRALRRETPTVCRPRRLRGAVRRADVPCTGRRTSGSTRRAASKPWSSGC